MVTLKKEMHHNYKRLKQVGTASFIYWGCPITARLVSEGSKLSLISPLFRGEGYIPQSLRASLSCSLRSPFPSIPASIHLDEKACEVSLRYIGKAEKSERSFVETLEAFASLASEWRSYLDERGGNDFVYVRRSS